MLLYKNNAYSALAAGINAAATTITVTTGQGDRFPEVVAPDFCLVTLQDASNNIEIIKVTARSSGADSMTVERAQEGTTARSWALGDIVELRPTAFGFQPLQILAGGATVQALRDALLVPSRTGGDASGTWSINISGNAANVTGVVAPANGGTGLSSYAVGDLLYASASATLAKLAAVATGNVLLSGGVATAPAWGKVGLTTHVDGTLGVPNGGTGAVSFTSGGILRGNGTGALSVASAADIVAAIGATAVANATNAVNVTGTVASGATGTTQAEKTANTTLATTAFVDRLRNLSTPATGASGTLVIGDRGAGVEATGTITVPSGVFAKNDVVTIKNVSGSPISIVQGSGLTLYNSVDGTTGSRTLGARGMATVCFVTASEAFIAGAGVS